MPKEDITRTGEIAKAVASTVYGGAWNAEEDEPWDDAWSEW